MQELEKILEEIEEYRNHVCKDYSRGIEFVAGAKRAFNGIDHIIRKHMNDGWISVDERLPEDDIDVLITYMDINDEDFKCIDITTYGYAFLGGNKLDYKEWRNPLPYFKGNYKVIAWQPLPEPYRPEQPETCKYTGGSCCWPIDQCSDCPNHPRKENNNDIL